MSGGGFGSAVDLTASADVADAGDGTTLFEVERSGVAARSGCRRRRTRARRRGEEGDREGVRQHPPAVDDEPGKLDERLTNLTESRDREPRQQEPEM